MAQSTTTPFTTATSTKSSTITSNNDIQKRLVEILGADHIMIEVARCESGFRQYNSNGTALHGGYNGKMIGIFQLYDDYHVADAKRLGFDIYNVEGNIKYAKWLFDKQGVQPWSSSSLCWGNKTSVVKTTSTETINTTSPLTRNLVVGNDHDEVRVLQKILNSHGYILTETGLGSPGQETTFFGTLSKLAVRNFQCKNNILCSGSEFTNGYGMVSGETRERLNALSTKIPIKTETAKSQVQKKDNTKKIEELLRQIKELERQVAELRS